MMTTTMFPAVNNDAELVMASLSGNRDAFGQIVSRYQSLICSLAYSATGSLGESEDLAQETFITAWKHLRHLRERTKLRAWLCGIARNRINNTLRREGREPLRAAESLEAVHESASTEPQPHDQAISKEEEAILWRSIERIPEIYREPLVLFYREHQSIESVATVLDLTEDAVKQRLSRGRKLLAEEVAAFVEGALSRTNPGKAFTIGVLVALPMVSASTASAALTAGAVAGGSAGTAGKGILAKLGPSAFVGPLIGLVCAYFGTKAAASTARSKEERDCILRYARYGIIVFCVVMSIGLAAVLSQAGKLYTASAAWLVLGVSAWTVVLVGAIMLMCQRMDREVKRIRIATKTTDEAYAKLLATQGRQLRLPKYFESKTRILGLPIYAVGWASYNTDQYRPCTVCGWLAVGDIAVSPLFAFGSVAVAPMAVGAITVGVLSLSLFGIAFGVLALGSLAFGWWAFGCAAVGVKCAVGFAAVARDYAVGIAVSAAEAGTTTAKHWVKTQWIADILEVMMHHMHWWILGCVAVALILRVWQQRRESRFDSDQSGR